MKQREKLFLLLAMLLSLCFSSMVVLADNKSETTASGSIQIMNPADSAEKGEGEEAKEAAYTAYKVFDVSYNEDKTAYSYTTDSAALAKAINEGNLKLTLTGVKGTEISGKDPAEYDLYVVEMNDGFSPAEFAAWLKGNTDLLVNKGTLSKTEDTLNGLELGYYLVTTDSGALCNLTTTAPDAKIYDKNVIEFSKAILDGTEKNKVESTEIGEEVTFVLDSKIPNYEGYDRYIYSIHDTMPAGLEFKRGSLVVKIGGDTLEENKGYVVTYPEKETGKSIPDFRLLITSKTIKSKTIGTPIEITYKATVVSALAGEEGENKAKLIYSSNPAQSGWGDPGNPDIPEDPDKPEDPEDPDEPETEEIEDKAKVYSAKIQVEKYAARKSTSDEGDSSEENTEDVDESKPLAGAKFRLYKMDGDKKLYYVLNENYETDDKSEEGDPVTIAKVEWLAESDISNTRKPDEKETEVADVEVDGETKKIAQIEFLGLEDGTYYLEETEAPVGYNRLTGPVEIVIEGTKTENDKTEVVKANLVKNEKVANNTGTQLPVTGGIGTTVFYVLGAILLAGAGILLVTRKRLADQENSADSK